MLFKRWPTKINLISASLMCISLYGYYTPLVEVCDSKGWAIRHKYYIAICSDIFTRYYHNIYKMLCK